MRHLSWKGRTFIAFTLTGLLILYIEILSYVLRSRNWSILPSKSKSSSTDNEEPLRVLLVADPQIQGELDESYLFGIVTRWDADSYLKKTFKLAKHHVNPHVIVFLGDLFDEGHKASKEEYQRYYARFKNIFDLPERDELSASTIKYIFVPGDNDVGGEREAVSELKLNWFNKTLGDYDGKITVRKNNYGAEFLTYNAFFPRHLIKPLNGRYDNNNNVNENIFTVLVSHVSLLKFISEAVQEVVDSVTPSLILSAHNHESNLYKFDYGTKNSLHTTVVKYFLREKKNQKLKQSQLDNSDMTMNTDDKSYRFHIKKSTDTQTIYEINVPTCSYRMGTEEMGYGYLQMFQDGTVDYTVLWTPSRFTQLYIYGGFYTLMKLVLSPYFLWKGYKYFIVYYKDYKIQKSKTYHSV